MLTQITKHISYVMRYMLYDKVVCFVSSKESVRRTTIILDEEERKYIDELIQQGAEPGIKPLISKLLDIYRSMMIQDWKYPGEYYCGISRVALVNVELINIMLQHVPEQKWREVGQKMGEAAKVSMEATLNLEITEKEKWPEAFKRLRVQGFGDFYARDKYFILKAPFINNPEVLRGFLEALLTVKLETRATTPPFVYEIAK